MENTIRPGKYQHFRNKQLYEVIGTALHSETLEKMVVYKALYDSEKFEPNQLWARPKAMFTEELAHEGEIVPRFKWISE